MEELFTTLRANLDPLIRQFQFTGKYKIGEKFKIEIPADEITLMIRNLEDNSGYEIGFFRDDSSIESLAAIKENHYEDMAFLSNGKVIFRKDVFITEQEATLVRIWDPKTGDLIPAQIGIIEDDGFCAHYVSKHLRIERLGKNYWHNSALIQLLPESLESVEQILGVDLLWHRDDIADEIKKLFAGFPLQDLLDNSAISIVEIK